jgi:hypothetical protein
LRTGNKQNDKNMNEARKLIYEDKKKIEEFDINTQKGSSVYNC